MEDICFKIDFMVTTFSSDNRYITKSTYFNTKDGFVANFGDNNIEFQILDFKRDTD